jgi:hypothetical protein
MDQSLVTSTPTHVTAGWRDTAESWLPGFLIQSGAKDHFMMDDKVR